jgi:23S rRNA (adenine2503-C2)-methyltransferase
MAMSNLKLCGMTPEEILGAASRPDVTIRHAISAANSVYKRKILRIREFPDIPRAFREVLLKSTTPGLFPPLTSEMSSDNAIKYLFRNDSGQQYETVFLPDGKRNTVCVSTQSGCRMGCSFCATGRYGYHGDLTVNDILNQVLSIPVSGKVTHVVFMGMGEPMDNLRNVLKACRIITAEWGLALGKRNVTVSTVGILPAVDTFLNESGCNLALSLYSPFTEERVKFIPAERRFPAVEIVQLMKSHATGSRRRMTIAYVMISGVNDSDRHLEELKKLTINSDLRVNILPYHPLPGDVLRPSDQSRVVFFRDTLLNTGISASIRRSRGEDISAACGLLASGLK